MLASWNIEYLINQVKPLHKERKCAKCTGMIFVSFTELNIEFSNKGSGQTDLWVFLRYEENIFGSQAPASQSAKDQQ